MNMPIRVSLWHRGDGGGWSVRKRMAIGLLVFLMPFAIVCGTTLTYDFDGSDLTIRKAQLYGLIKGREVRIPLPDKVVFDTESQGSGCLCVFDGGGYRLWFDELGEDAERFRAGLTQAVQKRPRGTFHGRHRDVPEWSDVLPYFVCVFFIACAPTRVKSGGK